MKNKIARIILLCSLFVSAPAFAEDAKLVIVPGIDLAYKTDELSVRTGVTSTKLASVRFNTLAPSMSFGYGKWFAHLSSEFTVVPGAFEQLTTNASGYEYKRSTFSRGESTLNVGYRVYDGDIGSVNIYGGFHDSKINIVQSIFTYDSSRPAPFDTVDSERADFNEKGPFVGINYTRPFGNHALTISAAYAHLDGTLDDFQTDNYNGTLSHEIQYANSRGLSFGAVWSGSLTDNMNYKVGYKYVDYRFDVTRIYNVITDTSTPIPAGTFQIYNKIDSIFAGVTVYL